MASQTLSYAVDGTLRALLDGSSEANSYDFVPIPNASVNGAVSQVLQQRNINQAQGWDTMSQLSSSVDANQSPFAFNHSLTSSGSSNNIPAMQSNLFYQPVTTMDISSDFSFLHRRPSSSCSQSIKPCTAPQTPSSVKSSTPQSTPHRQNQSDATAKLNSTPTPRPLLRQTLSQQRRRKVASGTPSKEGSSTAASTSSSTTSQVSKMASLFSNTKRLPLRLPRPPLCLISDPYADLCGHLRRHGMHTEARDFSAVEGITTDFALRSWIQTSAGGAEGLLNQTNVFLAQHALIVQSQMNLEKDSSQQALPSSFNFPVAKLDSIAEGQCLTPTHILAVHGVEEAPGKDSRGLLLPCHGLMYALQCVSLPAFPTSIGRQEGEVLRTLPVVSLRVPRPAEFPTLHRYLYTHDASALLVDLLPMKHIARHWDHAKSKQSDTNLPTLMAPASATNALAHLPTQSLFGFAYKIHSGWANGVAIGLLDSSYWSTLDRAWNLIIAAMTIKKARMLDTELKTSPMNQRKASL